MSFSETSSTRPTPPGQPALHPDWPQPGRTRLTGAGVALTAMQGWQDFRFDAGLAQDVGHVRFAGITHAADGTVRGFVDGAPVGDPS